MGEPFFDCQVGFVGCRALCLKSIMGVRDFEENMHRSEEVITSTVNGMKWSVLFNHMPPFLSLPPFYLCFSRMLCSSAVGTLSITKEWPTLPTLCLITAVQRTTALGQNSSWMQQLTRSGTGHDPKYSCSYEWLRVDPQRALMPLHHLQWIRPTKHVICDILSISTIKWFFFLQRLTTKHLKGTHRADSSAKTIWQKLVSQFQVRPTTSSTCTSQLGQQAFTATGCYYSTNGNSLKNALKFMKLLFFNDTCHWHGPYSTKFVASSFGCWRKKRNHTVHKDMLLRHMFLYFFKNNGFTEDLWLITEPEFFLFKCFTVDVVKVKNKHIHSQWFTIKWGRSSQAAMFYVSVE